MGPNSSFLLSATLLINSWLRWAEKGKLKLKQLHPLRSHCGVSGGKGGPWPPDLFPGRQMADGKREVPRRLDTSEQCFPECKHLHLFCRRAAGPIPGKSTKPLGSGSSLSILFISQLCVLGQVTPLLHV